MSKNIKLHTARRTVRTRSCCSRPATSTLSRSSPPRAQRVLSRRRMPSSTGWRAFSAPASARNLLPPKRGAQKQWRCRHVSFCARASASGNTGTRRQHASRATLRRSGPNTTGLTASLPVVSSRNSVPRLSCEGHDRLGRGILVYNARHVLACLNRNGQNSEKSVP